VPQYTFEGPGGQRHTIEGPEGSTPEEAFKILQQHLGQAQAPAASPANDYRSKLTDALNVAMKALAPSWEHNGPSYSPYKPAQPGNMPNDAINPVGNDAQMTAALGAAGAARLGAGALAGGAGRAAVPPQVGPVNMARMPTQSSFGTQMAQNVGQGASQAIGGGAAAAATPQAAGNALQTQLLRAGLEHVANGVGHSMGIPMAGTALRTAARFAPKVLGF